MILDYENEFTRSAAIGTAGTSEQAISGTAGTAILGVRVFNAGNAKNWGAGELVKPYLRVTEAVVGASGGVKFQVIAADNAALSTNPIVLSEKTIATADLTLKSIHELPALESKGSKQYCGLAITPLTTNSTAGKVIVGLVDKDGRPQNGFNNL